MCDQQTPVSSEFLFSNKNQNKIMKKNQHDGDILKYLCKIMRIMRLSLFLVIVSTAMAFSANSYSQNKKLTVDLNNASVKEVLKAIEDQSEFLFFYQEKHVDLNRQVTLHASEQDVETILNQLFAGTNNIYVINDRQIVLGIAPRKELEMQMARLKENVKSVIEQPQQKEISGKVTDAGGLPLPGVSVIVKGTTIGTVTDNDGAFSLNIPLNAETLQFSFVGMRTQEVPIAGRTIFTVVMEEETIGLEEVVAVGYGTQKKANLTGAVGTVGGEKLEARPINSVGEGLQGLVANLNVTVYSGDPRQAVDFNIRGYESITGGSPLVLVDGVPTDVNIVNPSDIKSISVLKDAAASAIYGARAGFGVILIETKDAQMGKVRVSFSSELSAERPIWPMERVTDSYIYASNRNVAQINATGSPMFSDETLLRYQQYSENPTPENAWGVEGTSLRFYGYNHYEERILKDFAPKQNYNLQFSGGTKNANFFASLGFLNKDGYLKIGNDNFKRYNSLIKVNFQITDWLSIEERVSFDSEISDFPHTYHANASQRSLARTEPNMILEFPAVELFEDELPEVLADRDYSAFVGLHASTTNWIPYLEQGSRDKKNNSKFWFTQRIGITPTKNFAIRGNFSYSLFNSRREDVAAHITKIGFLGSNSLDISQSYEQLVGPDLSDPDYVQVFSSNNHNFVFDAFAEYTIEEEDSPHYFKGMVGYNQEWAQNFNQWSQAFDLHSPLVHDLNATSGAQQTRGGKSHMALRGTFYRVNYIYDDKYLVELNGRYDGTSRFPKDDRFGFFPSFSAGWRISEEKFLDNIDFMNNLKVRASYGSLGNQDVSYYPYIPQMATSMQSYLMYGNKIPVVRSPGLVSPNLTWEKVITRNLGFDITLFQKLTASFDTYVRETKDMLMNVYYPQVLGTAAPQENAADLATKGWEFTFSYNNKIGNDWDYSATFNLADWTSEITKYENPTGALSEYYVGQQLGEIWGYETVGLFQNEEEVQNAADQSQLGTNWAPGDVHYADRNNDGKINVGSNTLDDPGDRKVIGNNSPRYSYGMDFLVRYKAFTVNVFFQGVGKRDFYPSTGNYQFSIFPWMTDHMEDYWITESWTEDNRDAYFARQTKQTVKNWHPQTRYLQNSAYIRLKNLMLSYNIPTQTLNRVGMERVQIYLTGMNLWESSKMHKPLDPEYIYTFEVPYLLQRTYSLGIRVNF